MRSLRLFLILCAACTGPVDNVQVELSPTVISSLDGSTTVTALVASESSPLADTAVQMAVTYTDRNGTPHDIAPVTGTTDERGIFKATIEGLTWDGVGQVDVTADGIVGSATFSVLDRTPPAIEILPPTTDGKVGAGLPVDVRVHVTDEIGVSFVVFDSDGNQRIRRDSLGGAGQPDVTLTFRIQVPQGAQNGSTITLHALASDLSGNLAAAAPLTLTVDTSITIATPPGLMGTMLADGTAQRLVSPTSIVMSPKDGRLYVTDAAGVTGCNPSCVWRVDATTGAVDNTAVYIGQGQLSGIALDATGDTMYLSDRQNRVTRLTWDGTAYTSPTACVDAAQQQPQDPYHLVFDATLGILVTEDNDRNVQRIATCATNSVGMALSAMNSVESPRGLALGPGGEIYVSDEQQDRVSRVDRTTGALTLLQSGLNAPWGIEWLAGGTSPFADALMVASTGDRVVESTKGMGALAAAYLRNEPIDMAISTGTMYVLTRPSGGNRGRIYKVTGF